MNGSPHVGTLGEKPLHAALKRWYSEDGDLVEEPVDGFVIDLVRGGVLIEIQTRGFSSLKRKLHTLLEGHVVCLVHPIPMEKWIVKLDDAGEAISRRKSPKRGAAIDIFGELVSFPDLIAHPNLTLEVLLTKEDEVRRFDPDRAWRRKGWVVEERRLLEVVERLEIDAPEDLAALLPTEIRPEFTTAQLAGALDCQRRLAQQMAYCLRNAGVIEAIGKEGNAVVYRRAVHHAPLRQGVSTLDGRKNVTSASDDRTRSVLPMPDQAYAGGLTYDAKDPASTFPPIEPLRPPSGAPNVIVALIDDCGFGASSAFGGPCETPTAERLAGAGLKYNRFHTTALCSPTRQALLTGRNHHSVGMGGITEMATSAPGYNSIRPNSAAPLAETLKLNGYSTAQFGKCHEVPVWETSPMGPFRQWPTGSGFEHFYGFIGGETNQYYPAIYNDTVPIEPDKTPEEGYHFTADMTDHAIEWVRQQKALMPDKPFFVYWAPGATHAPHHVPEEWSAKYRGRFDDGWDAQRERTIARQKELGVIPEDAVLMTRHDQIPGWDETPDDLKPVLARQMEVYAGFLEHTDHQLGRLVDAVDDLGALDNTLIYYIIGDNGASAEGTPNGTFNELMTLNGVLDIETTEFMAERIDDFGGPDAFNHYAVGWAHAMDTPYQWTKQVASHWGGTRNGTIVHWPAGIEAAGEVRQQFHHVIDVATTVLDAAGLPEPQEVNGVAQMPLHGVSMRYSFDDPAPPNNVRRSTSRCS